MRISAVTDLYIKEFAGGSITKASSYIKNGVIDKYPEMVSTLSLRDPELILSRMPVQRWPMRQDGECFIGKR